MNSMRTQPVPWLVIWLHLALAARAMQLGDGAEVLLGHVDGQLLDRARAPCRRSPAGDDLRLTDGELETFATHGLDEDRQRHLATTLDLPGVRTLGRQHAQRHVADQLGVEPVLDHGAR